MEPLEAVQAWQRLANGLRVTHGGSERTWAQHIAGAGYVDEEGLVQPVAFPRFVDELLGFTVGETLAAEYRAEGVKPDFTPADAVTHPFVFETKSTNMGSNLEANEQVRRYLTEGRPRIRRVVLTNLVGLRVYELGADGELALTVSVNLLGLLSGPPETLDTTGDARRLASFLDEYRYRELTTAEKLERVRAGPPWNPIFEVTNPSWLSARLDRVVEVLRHDVARQVETGALADPALVPAADRPAIEAELRELEWRIASDPDDPLVRPLAAYLAAPQGSDAYKALMQYEAHVAYYTATRMLLVRIWEDLGLLDAVLYDGGFDQWMERLQGEVQGVVDWSFRGARERYPSLFDRRNSYTWYVPAPDAIVDAIYELANTYFGSVESDVLGGVYERLLERVDRKLLGQYYTPRDVIRLIWDLVDPELEAAESPPLVLDIATGSGGFLVEAARRLRETFEIQRAAGARLEAQEWVNQLSESLVGVEIQRFPAYLAEVNLLIQIGLTRTNGGPRIPPLGVIWGDTLSLHNTQDLGLNPPDAAHDPTGLLQPDTIHVALYEAIKHPDETGRWVDVAVGNPPYVGEKKAASVLRHTRERYPYWAQFIAPHLDYLYWFLVLGVSKLAAGGRFGFITTEYWLRSDGGRPLREYLADRCHIEAILLFRNLRLFPDAPGQHSMVVIGERVAADDYTLAINQTPVTARRPRVSVYTGPDDRMRSQILASLREGRTSFGVVSFQASVSPNALRGESWAEVILTRDQVTRRRRVQGLAGRLELDMEEGVIAGADRLRRADEAHLTAAAMAELGPGAQPPIFVFHADEIAGLGPLAESERRVLRRVVNTRDVFPYAAVPPAAADRLLFLPRPAHDGNADVETIRNAPIPNGMPNIERHLRRYEALLRRKVIAYRERRPWWSIHRPRPRIQAAEGNHPRWSNYALTTRWGSGGSLAVGLAPRGIVPASGLQAIIPAPPATAAYLVGLMNSTLVQQLAEGLPPGEIRQTDLAALGLPSLPAEIAAQMGDLTLELADVVQEIVTDYATRWPSLADALRSDISLGAPRLDAWRPMPGGTRTWGTVESVAWLEKEFAGAQSQRITSVDHHIDLFGIVVVARGASGILRLRLVGDDEDAASALYLVVRSVMLAKGQLRDVARAPLPVDPRRLVTQLSGDRQAVTDAIESYRTRRTAIDALVDQLL